jgi:hypothetical protein
MNPYPHPFYFSSPLSPVRARARFFLPPRDPRPPPPAEIAPVTARSSSPLVQPTARLPPPRCSRSCAGASLLRAVSTSLLRHRRSELLRRPPVIAPPPPRVALSPPVVGVALSLAFSVLGLPLHLRPPLGLAGAAAGAGLCCRRRPRGNHLRSRVLLQSLKSSSPRASLFRPS